MPPLELQEINIGSPSGLDLEPLDLEPIDIPGTEIPSIYQKAKTAAQIAPTIFKTVYPELGREALKTAETPSYPLRRVGGQALGLLASGMGTTKEEWARKYPKMYGAGQGVSELGESLTSPMNLALLLGPAALKLPKIAHRMMSGGFAAQMAASMPEEYKAYKEAVDRGDQREAMRIGTLLVGTGLFTAGGIRGAMPEGPRPITRRAAIPEETRFFDEMAIKEQAGMAPPERQLPYSTMVPPAPPPQAPGIPIQQMRPALPPPPGTTFGPGFTARENISPQDLMRARLNAAIQEGMQEGMTSNALGLLSAAPPGRQIPYRSIQLGASPEALAWKEPLPEKPQFKDVPVYVRGQQDPARFERTPLEMTPITPEGKTPQLRPTFDELNTMGSEISDYMYYQGRTGKGGGYTISNAPEYFKRSYVGKDEALTILNKIRTGKELTEIQQKKFNDLYENFKLEMQGREGSERLKQSAEKERIKSEAKAKAEQQEMAEFQKWREEQKTKKELPEEPPFEIPKATPEELAEAERFAREAEEIPKPPAAAETPAGPVQEIWKTPVLQFFESRQQGPFKLDVFEAKNIHKQEVQRALSEGKTVPPEVLKDYPDLAPRAAAPAKPPAAPEPLRLEAIEPAKPKPTAPEQFEIPGTPKAEIPKGPAAAPKAEQVEPGQLLEGFKPEKQVELFDKETLERKERAGRGVEYPEIPKMSFEDYVKDTLQGMTIEEYQKVYKNFPQFNLEELKYSLRRKYQTEILGKKETEFDFAQQSTYRTKTGERVYNPSKEFIPGEQSTDRLYYKDLIKMDPETTINIETGEQVRGRPKIRKVKVKDLNLPDTPRWPSEAGAVINPAEAISIIIDQARKSKTLDEFRKSIAGNKDLIDTARYYKMNLEQIYQDPDNSPYNLSKTKAVDATGKPIALYSGHANVQMYGKFEPKKATAGGFFATTDPEIASNYALGKFGVKESFEHGSQYRLPGKEGKLNKKIWQYELSQEQLQKLEKLKTERDKNGDLVNEIGEMDRWIEQNKRFDKDALRMSYTGGSRRLQNIHDFLEYMGYNIAYAKEARRRLPSGEILPDRANWLSDKATETGYKSYKDWPDNLWKKYNEEYAELDATAENIPYHERQQKNRFEDLLDELGIKWDSHEWARPGVKKVYLNIKNPIDTSKPFPADVLAALKQKAKYERTVPDSGLSTKWTQDYPLKEWIKDIETGNEYWSTQIPKKAREILQQYGYDGIKDTGGKGGGPKHDVWIAFRQDQVINALDWPAKKAGPTGKWPSEAGAALMPPQMIGLLYQMARDSKSYQDFRKKVSENKDLRDTARLYQANLQQIYDEREKQKEQQAIQKVFPGQDPTAVTSPAAAPAPVRPIREKETALLDRFAPLKREGKKEIGEQYGEAYVGARLLSGKIRGLSEKFIDEMNVALKPVRSYDERLNMEQIYALRNFAELDRAGKTTSKITAPMANKMLADLKTNIGEEAFTRLSAAADKLAQVQNDNVLDYLVERNVITKETAKTWKERYPHYLKTEVIDDQLNAMFPQYRGMNAEPLATLNTSFLKTKKGTPLTINTSVLDVIRRSIVSKVALAEKMDVIDRINREFGVQIGSVERGPDLKALKRKTYATRAPAGYQENTVPTKDGNIYALPDDINNLVKGLDREDVDIITKAIAKYNSVFRAGATMYRAPFVINNIVRDVANAIFVKRGAEAGLQTKGEIPIASTIANMAHGFIDAVKNQYGIKTELMKEFLEGGSGYGGLMTQVAKEKGLPLRLQTPGQKAVTITKNTVGLPVELISDLAEISENTTRLAEFLRAKTSNLSPELKNLQARDITVDFEKMGNAMMIFNKWIPFLNANIQGLTNTVRAAKQQPKTTAFRLGTQVIAPTIGLYALWKTQFSDDYDKVDSYIKQNYWIVPTGIRAKNSSGQMVPVTITIRKNEFSQSISNVIEAFLEFSTKKDKTILQNIKESSGEYLQKNVLNQMIGSVVPPIIKTPIELLSNYSLFTQRPIVPRRMERIEPRYQTVPGDTKLSRMIGQAANVSPAKTEYAIRGVFPAAREISPIYEKGLELLGGKLPETVGTTREKELTTPEKVSRYLPFFRLPRGEKGSEEIYKFKEKTETEKKTVDYLAKEAMIRYMQDRTPENQKAAIEAMSKVKPQSRVYLRRAAIEEVRSKQSQTIRAFSSMPRSQQREYIRTMTPDERRKFLKTVQR